MAQDTLLGFPAHTLPFRCGESTSLSTASFSKKGSGNGHSLPDTALSWRDTPEPIRLGRPCKTPLVQAAAAEPRIP